MSQAKLAPMSVWQRHHGIWEGTYTRMDARTGEVLDRHHSRLHCRIVGNEWQQTNCYWWDDGREERVLFPGQFDPDGWWLRFDTKRLVGNSRVADGNCIFLEWRYKDQPDNNFTELITLISDTHRGRIWQHFENGEFAKITVIDERKISDDPTLPI